MTDLDQDLRRLVREEIDDQAEAELIRSILSWEEEQLGKQRLHRTEEMDKRIEEHIEAVGLETYPDDE